jgi:hypothetical protein
MNYTGKTTIAINGSTYPLKFGMGALIHFSEDMGYDVQETIDSLTKPGFQQIKAISKFIYSALVVEALFKDKALDVTYDDVVDWVDINSPAEISRIVRVIMFGLSTISEIEYPAEESKKK